MATMAIRMGMVTKTPPALPVDDDPEVRRTQAAYEGAQRARETARAAYEAVAPPIGVVSDDEAVLTAKWAWRRAAKADDTADQARQAARAAALARLSAELAAEEREDLAKLLAVAETAHTEAVAFWRRREQRAARKGVQPGEHPLFPLLAMRDRLEALRRSVG